MPAWPDLHDLWRFSVHPVELFVRGSAVYLSLYLLLRFVLRRDTGALGVADLLLLLLVADASQNAMAGSYETVADGAVLIGTILGWNWAVDTAAYRSRRLRKILQPPPLVLVRRGQLVRRNLERESITTPELMSRLHEQGIAKLSEVRHARLELSGEISVIRETEDPDDDRGGPPKRRAF